jgi:hypothetical protein
LARQQLRLIETALALASAMERDRQDKRSTESFLLHMMAKLLSKRPGQRNAARILEVMKDSTHRIGKHEQRPCEIECMISAAARATQSFNHGRRHPTPRTERPRNRLEFRPAFLTGDRPAPLEDAGVAEDTRLRENKIQERVDHDDLSSTQRACLIYFE